MKKYGKIMLMLLTLIFLSFNSNSVEDINVVIDSGHGGTDYGNIRNEFTEKSIIDSITKKIKDSKIKPNINLHFTRINDENVAYKKRVEFINTIQPDLVISLHVNSLLNSEANGFEIYVSTENKAIEKSKQYAEEMAKKLEEKITLKNRGIKSASLFILKKSEVPAICLELGFLSNDNDRDYLVSDVGQNQISNAIIEFISNLNK